MTRSMEDKMVFHSPRSSKPNNLNKAITPIFQDNKGLPRKLLESADEEIMSLMSRDYHRIGPKKPPVHN
ncbi:unnamed protein product [Amaranthus hypochondriacus]